MKMEIIVNAVLLSGIITITTQDIIGRKSCDCSICNGVSNKLNGVVGNKFDHDSGGKSGCSICEKKKEILQMEKERQQKLQKCPFELLGASNIKGKSSQEVFDEFREMIVPSQNGFFDMMRGIVRTMHVSSEAELKWAKEKEAKELAKKKEEEALRKLEEAKVKKEEELVNLKSPIHPKVTVVLKQTPCGQILAPSETIDDKKVPLAKRLPKEITEDILTIPKIDEISKNDISDLQLLELTAKEQPELNYLNVDSQENLLNSDLIDQLMGYNNMWSTDSPYETTETEPETDIFIETEETNRMEASTESPFVKFVSDEELKAEWKNSRNSADDIDMGLNLLPTATGEELQVINENI